VADKCHIGISNIHPRLLQGGEKKRERERETWIAAQGAAPLCSLITAFLSPPSPAVLLFALSLPDGHRVPLLCAPRPAKYCVQHTIVPRHLLFLFFCLEQSWSRKKAPPRHTDAGKFSCHLWCRWPNERTSELGWGCVVFLGRLLYASPLVSEGRKPTARAGRLVLLLWCKDVRSRQLALQEACQNRLPFLCLDPWLQVPFTAALKNKLGKW